MVSQIECQLLTLRKKIDRTTNLRSYFEMSQFSIELLKCKFFSSKKCRKGNEENISKFTNSSNTLKICTRKAFSVLFGKYCDCRSPFLVTISRNSMLIVYPIYLIELSNRKTSVLFPQFWRFLQIHLKLNILTVVVNVP